MFCRRCHVRELRVLYDQLHDQGLLSGSGAVAEYWADKLQQLPKDEENLMVSADEISAALLQWLEDLLGYAEGSEAGSRAPGRCTWRYAKPANAIRLKWGRYQLAEQTLCETLVSYLSLKWRICIRKVVEAFGVRTKWLLERLFHHVLTHAASSSYPSFFDT